MTTGVVTSAPPREVVACLLSHEDRYLLLKRSRRVGSDRGCWHCVTGFCEPGVDPLEQAVREVHEETGMPPEDVRLLRRAPLRLDGRDGEWTVHAFHFACSRSRVRLNWRTTTRSGWATRARRGCPRCRGWTPCTGPSPRPGSWHCAI